jgi:hypothetical protein
LGKARGYGPGKSLTVQSGEIPSRSGQSGERSSAPKCAEPLQAAETAGYGEGAHGFPTDEEFHRFIPPFPVCANRR